MVTVTDLGGNIATVTMSNTVGINGAVHVIDTVLSAQTNTIVDIAIATPELSTLVSALTTAGLVETLQGEGPFTVLAPTNDAFDAITVPPNVTVLTDILLYHVIGATVLSTDLSSGLIATALNGESVTAFIDGSGVFFFDSNGRSSQVAQADIIGTNGVIHIVDSVLLPGGTVNDIVSNIPSLSSLSGALIATGLNTTLADPTGTFTLFAPTNDAISAFTGTIDSALLLYHVVATEYVSDDIPEATTTLPTVNGANVDVTKNATGVFVEDLAGGTGTVTMANIKGINGVVHVIDIVLSPTA